MKTLDPAEYKAEQYRGHFYARVSEMSDWASAPNDEPILKMNLSRPGWYDAQADGASSYIIEWE